MSSCVRFSQREQSTAVFRVFLAIQSDSALPSGRIALVWEAADQRFRATYRPHPTMQASRRRHRSSINHHQPWSQSHRGGQGAHPSPSQLVPSSARLSSEHVPVQTVQLTGKRGTDDWSMDQSSKPPGLTADHIRWSLASRFSIFDLALWPQRPMSAHGLTHRPTGSQETRTSKLTLSEVSHTSNDQRATTLST